LFICVHYKHSYETIYHPGFPYTFHGSTPACHKSHNTKTSSQFQQHSGGLNMPCRTKTPRRPSNCVENLFSPVIWARRYCCPPFQIPIFSSFKHYPGLAGIVRNRNCRIRPRILQKKCPRHSHFCHLKYHITRMPDHLGSYLNQLLSTILCCHSLSISTNGLALLNQAVLIEELHQRNVVVSYPTTKAR